MNKKIICQILFFVEIVLSLRILFFTIPVFISRMGKSSVSITSDDVLIRVLTLAAVAYLMTGVISLLRPNSQKLLHLISAVMVVGFCSFLFVQGFIPHQYKNVIYLVVLSSVFAAIIIFVSAGQVKLSRKILVVDDDEMHLKTIRPILLEKGYEVVTAKTGEEGLAAAKNENPGLIILDVIMPGIKGREVCRRLKSDAMTKHIPVVFLTSKDSPDDVAAEISVGAIKHLTKPINSKVLIDTVTEILG